MKNKEIKKNNNMIYLLLLFLASSNVGLIGIYIFLIMGLYVLFINRKIIANSHFICLLLFSFGYFFTTFASGASISHSIKIFICPLIWIMSYLNNNSIDKDWIKKVVLTLALGTASHGIINCLYNTYVGTNLQSGVTYDFWSKVYSASTGQATNFTILVAISFYLLFLYKGKKTIKYIGIISMIISFYYDIQIGGRTILVLIIFSMLIGFVLFCYYSPKDFKYRKKILPTMFLFAVLIFSLYGLYQNDIFKVRSTYENSFLYVRFTKHNATDLVGNDRFWKKISYIKNMNKYMLGGNHLSKNEGFGNAHELWLDIYDDAGVFAFVFIWIYTIMSVHSYFRIQRYKEIDIPLKIMFISFVLILLLQFWVEPILSGSPMLLYSYILVDGMLVRWLNEKKVIKE